MSSGLGIAAPMQARRSEFQLTLVLSSCLTVWTRVSFAKILWVGTELVLLFIWRAISKARRIAGRRKTSKEVRDLIFRMVAENPTWGAPRIHGERLMLGFHVPGRRTSRLDWPAQRVA